MQRLLGLGQGFQHLGPGLGELLLLLVGARPGDGASQPGDFEECPADLEDVAELGRPPQECVRGLAADAPPGQQVLPSSVRVATPLSTVTTPRPASSPMASSAMSCGGVNAPSVASDTRCTTCAASAGPSSSSAAVTNAARLRKWRPPGPKPCPKPGPPRPPCPSLFCPSRRRNRRRNRATKAAEPGTARSRRSRARRSRVHRSRRKIHQTSLSFLSISDYQAP